MKPDGSQASDGGAIKSEGRVFWTTCALGWLMTPFALILAQIAGVNLASLVHMDVASAVIGLAATGPLALMLCWFMGSRWEPIDKFRASQLELFREIGFRLTPMRSLMLALAAGVGEEMLFRGVLQTYADRHWTLALAIVAPNILFGALHARSRIYALAAAAVGVYLGVLFWLTGNLIAPIVTHAAYDFVALEWARRVLNEAPSSADRHAPPAVSFSIFTSKTPQKKLNYGATA